MKSGLSIHQTKALWFDSKLNQVVIIDQTVLPHQYIEHRVGSALEMVDAIRSMKLRGAPLIGTAAAYGMYFAFIEAKRSDQFQLVFESTKSQLHSARPTAVNLMDAVDFMIPFCHPDHENIQVLEAAQQYENQNNQACYGIGLNGLELIRDIYTKTKKTVQILTHCNAGWLATGTYGTATAPIYLAHEAGIPVHVWVDETRPRNQGANLTSWELMQMQVPHTVIADNTGGHLMQHAMVDMVIVGSDRTTANGDVANKIGTYLKALAAFDNKIPFYVALPLSTIDFELCDGISQIPIEERGSEELTHILGIDEQNMIRNIRIYAESTSVINYGFDVTPARLVTALITEKGVVKANKEAISRLTNFEL